MSPLRFYPLFMGLRDPILYLRPSWKVEWPSSLMDHPMSSSSLQILPCFYRLQMMIKKHPIGSILRLFRFLALLISLLLPAFYDSVINFHQELLATVLLVQIISTWEGVPLPVLVEVFIREALFELLRKAGILLPQPTG